MKNYICKIASLDEIIKRMDYLIEIHQIYYQIIEPI